MSSRGGQGGEQMDMEGNQWMDMGDDGEHETDDMEMTGGHETGDLTASGSGHKATRKSHIIMPPLVLDSEDAEIVVEPTGDM
jgi:hypothetical protein